MAVEGAWGLQYFEVQSLCSLAYAGSNSQAGKTYEFPNARTRWTIESVHQTGAFRAITARRNQSDMRVLSYSGTDEWRDWIDNATQQFTGLSVQYIQAGQLATSVNCNVLVGHSLGGGLASYGHLASGKPAATINGAPLAWNNIVAGRILNRRLGSFPVINYVVLGEPLAVFDAATGNTSNKIGRTVRVGTNAGFSPVGRHSLDQLDGFIAPRAV